MKLYADQEILFFPWGSGEGELEGGDVAIDNFTILIFIIITVIYRRVNNRLIYKFVKNDAQLRRKCLQLCFCTKEKSKCPVL